MSGILRFAQLTATELLQFGAKPNRLMICSCGNLILSKPNHERVNQMGFSNQNFLVLDKNIVTGGQVVQALSEAGTNAIWASEVPTDLKFDAMFVNDQGSVLSQIFDQIKEARNPPLIYAFAEAPKTCQIAEAVALGAIDYFSLPLIPAGLTARFALTKWKAEVFVILARERFQARKALASLSPRQRQVFYGLVTGKSNKMIARDLRISHRTVEIHRGNLRSKIDINNPLHAAKILLLATQPVSANDASHWPEWFLSDSVAGINPPV